ncbi:MAG: hypothetical protein IJN69_02880 [Oscillospiraceae bacterium]|nr:hypothetical protein [Oscillospiraceae bacterium]MBR2503790.1 hypothetical protein [Oscillospiraceae bacterium]
MNKFEIATKAVGCITVALIFVGLFNMSAMETLVPFIFIGAAATLGLYVLTAFKTKNYGRMSVILILAAFIAVIMIYNKVL